MDHRQQETDQTRARAWLRPGHREITSASVFPLFRMRKPREVTSFHGRRVLLPLTDAEYATAFALRLASLRGRTFREMISAIEEAGFRVRPSISRSKAGSGYFLQGFSFTRDGMTLMASEANMRIIEDPNQPRAPRLAEDGEYLIALRVAYDLDQAPHLTAKRLLISDVRDICLATSKADELAEALSLAGVEAQLTVQPVMQDGLERKWDIVSLARDGANVVLNGRQQHLKGDRRLKQAARMMIGSRQGQDLDAPAPDRTPEPESPSLGAMEI